MKRFFYLFRNNLQLLKNVWRTSSISRWSLLISLVILFLMVVIPFWRLQPIGQEASKFIPLHYNIFFGVDKFGPWYLIFQLPFFGLIFLLVNYFLALKFFAQEKVLFLFFPLTTLILEVILLIAMVFTILLNL
ncbi:MAG: hypothetical protein V1664_02390 [Candidatus Uhrbacteria bacterium]